MQPVLNFLQTTQGKLIAGAIALTLCGGPLCVCFGGGFIYLLTLPPSQETAPLEAEAPALDGPAPTALSAEATAPPVEEPTLPPTAPPTATLPSTATPAEAPTEAPPATAAPPTATEAATTEIIEEPAPASLPDVALQEAQVVNVVDGDTIDVLIDGTEYRIRYILVDTPETHGGTEPFGPEASAFNAQLVGGQTVWLEKDVSETDRYDRLLRYVYLKDGRMVNEELLRAGLATVATFPPDVKYVERFRAVEQAAQAAGAGLWAGVEAAPPADEPAPAEEEAAVPPPSEPTEGETPAEEEAAPVATAAPPPATTDGPLVITALNKRDEYADIENVSGAAVDLTGWRLLSEKGNQDCALGGVIEPGQTLRVWALSADAAEGGVNCGFGRNIWNNSERDPAVLFDAGGAEVARME